MVDYLPWSNDVLKRCLYLHDMGKMPSLDLELTAKCTGACCVYCDSKPATGVSPKIGAVGIAHPEELNWDELHSLLEQSKGLGLEWIYTCGLGEPLEDLNFWALVDYVKINKLHLSIFSNGVFIQNIEIAKRLKDAGVCIILKMDTFDEEKFDEILGCKGKAKLIYRARDLLLEAGYGQNPNISDLAFSIVPTALSIDGIPDVIAFCEDKHIFASIGELEHAGEVMKNEAKVLNDLSLSKQQILALKNIANNYAKSECYLRPICPSILTGMHVDYIGNVITDKKTGLNCKWFLLSEPDIEVFGNIKINCLETLFKKVSEYRQKCFKNNEQHIIECENTSYVFGGCGGNPKNIIRLAKKHLLTT